MLMTTTDRQIRNSAVTLLGDSEEHSAFDGLQHAQTSALLCDFRTRNMDRVNVSESRSLRD